MARQAMAHDAMGLVWHPDRPGRWARRDQRDWVYAQLVAAHVGERGAATSAIETQAATWPAV